MNHKHKKKKLVTSGAMNTEPSPSPATEDRLSSCFRFFFFRDVGRWQKKKEDNPGETRESYASDMFKFCLFAIFFLKNGVGVCWKNVVCMQARRGAEKQMRTCNSTI